MKRLVLYVMVASGAAMATPEVSDVSLAQPKGSGMEVIVSYRLSGAPAIVCMDIQTNGPAGWATIGADAIYGDGFVKGAPSGDVNVVVQGDGDKRITWRPRKTWPDHAIPAGGARAVLTAYAADNAPLYMGVNLLTGEHRFFASEDMVPGGVKAEAWRRTQMLFRRIPAHGVTWSATTDFSSAANWGVHTFSNDFYAAVFETTQAQWRQLCGTAVAPYVAGDLLPMERTSYRDVRETDATLSVVGAANEAYMYPNPPCPESFLGRLRELTKCAAFPAGIDFDLPGEIQWRYACLAGHDAEHWGDGTPATTGLEVSGAPGRCSNSSPGGGAPAECGSYAPNSWGLYDMHGNVFELCLDWFITNPGRFSGLVNADGAHAVAPPSETSSTRVRCGGWYGVSDAHATGGYRLNSGSDATTVVQAPSDRNARAGFRVFCRAGLR